tara:strand:- start:95 stop:253 length:159 start_codon:yes stop_codon:yes gene_type:complete
VGKNEKEVRYNERRVENKSRGTVPWDEAYERRKKPHKYKEVKRNNDSSRAGL